MIQHAEARGQIKPGDTLIEATSGNTGIALAMAAAIKGYKMKLIMPDNSSAERKASMTAYGAELISVSKEQGMEGARDLALAMQARGEGIVLDQFSNMDNPEAHYQGTGPESIPGIRKWPTEYLPKIFDKSRVDLLLDIGQDEAESTMRALAQQEGIFCGVSSGGSVAGALRLAQEVENAVIVCIICDRGDRYLSTGVFS